jgi:hypothetical protein
LENSNAPSSPNRSTGLARAQARMSAQGIANTNNPLSAHHATGHARASARHALAEPNGVHHSTQHAADAIGEKVGRQ